MLDLKQSLIILAVIVFFPMQGLAEKSPIPPIEKASMDQQISYAIGYDIFKNLEDTIKLDLEYLLMGAKDYQAKTSKLTEEQIKSIMMSYQRIARQKQIENLAKESEQNQALGEKFANENKKKPGVITLSSGLQYKVITEGKGVLPKASDTVECHYKGTLLDGTVFDSSYKRGEPASFQVNGVIKGWTEALMKMKVGSKWMLYIPSDLAYGERGAGPRIKPGTFLIFEVELLGIVE